jgi:carbohydrate-selective porin OprB
VYATSTTPGTAAAGSLIFGVRQAFTAGLQIPMRSLPDIITFNKRQRDVFGVAWARIYPDTAAGSPSTGLAGIPVSRDPENIIEGYYRLQVNDNFAFIPSTQVRFSRMGNEDNEVEVIIGLRTSFTF